jgi:PAS domain S-box-containing protein
MMGVYMSFRIFLEIFRACISILLLIILIIKGKSLVSLSRKGYKFIILGFSLIAFASVLDITDNFPSLDCFIIIGNTFYQAILEKLVGYIGGLFFLTIGFWVWLPKVHELKNTQDQLKLALENEIDMNNTIINEKTQLAVTLNSIGDGVISVDINGKVVMLNPEAANMTGWTFEEAQGQDITNIFKIVKEGSDLKLDSPIEKVLKTGEIVELANHTELISKTGKRISIADSGAPVRNSEGEIIGVVLVFRDVTKEQEYFEEKLKFQKLESIGVLAGGIAHDFNNLLMGIHGNLLLAIDYDDLNDEVLGLLDTANKATQRATKLTKQLLTFSKGGEPTIHSVAIEKVVEDAAEFILTGSNIKCFFSVEKKLWKAKADKGQISQVIENLILNARQSMPNGGEINISINNVLEEEVKDNNLEKGQYISIMIKDNGCGIDKESLNKIFDPYFSTKSAGSGLGLATVFSIIKKHDGKIKVDSEKENYTVFTIYLHAESKVVSEKVNDHSTFISSKPVKEKVLVMDDEPFIRDLLQMMLEKIGYEALLAKDGQDAIKLYNDSVKVGDDIAFVMLDLTIPGGMGGEETAKKLLVINENIKMLVMSGYADDPVIARYKEYGFCGSLFKPFDMNQLRELIVKII